MKAFALVDDHAAQEAVWADLPEWNNSTDAIRRALTVEEISADHRLARLVGIEAYEHAGGTVLRDLFDDERDVVLADGALVERLAAEALEQAASIIRSEGWSWVGIALKPAYSISHGRVYLERGRGRD